MATSEFAWNPPTMDDLQRAGREMQQISDALRDAPNITSIALAAHYATLAVIVRWAGTQIDERDRLLRMGCYGAELAMERLQGPNNYFARHTLQQFAEAARPLVPKRPEPAPNSTPSSE